MGAEHIVLRDPQHAALTCDILKHLGDVRDRFNVARVSEDARTLVRESIVNLDAHGKVVVHYWPWQGPTALTNLVVSRAEAPVARTRGFEDRILRVLRASALRNGRGHIHMVGLSP
jgi:hypothetical protein